jgi:alcohol dehydrogenase/L-iditol 2-dehydrogenase
MRALRLTAIGAGNVEMQDVPVPTAGESDVLVQVACAGICGSDVKMYHGDMGAEHGVRPPVTMGHEFSGVIAEAGAGVVELAVGDRVTVETHAVTCGCCRWCRTGYPGLCKERVAFGHGVDGGFAEYVRAPAHIVHRVPEPVTLCAAAMTEPSCVAYNAVFEQSDVRPGDSVLILGPGPIGLLALQMAQLGGASLAVVVGLEPDQPRLDIARRNGADVVLRADEADVVEAIADLTGGLGVDLVIDAAGNSAALQTAVDCVRPRGQITKIGWGPKPVGFSLDPLVQKAATLRGSFSHTWPMWERCLGLMATGQLHPERLAQQIPFDRWRDGMSLAEERQAVKVVLTLPGHTA